MVQDAPVLGTQTKCQGMVCGKLQQSGACKTETVHYPDGITRYTAQSRHMNASLALPGGTQPTIFALRLEDG